MTEETPESEELEIDLEVIKYVIILDGEKVTHRRRGPFLIEPKLKYHVRKIDQSITILRPRPRLNSANAELFRRCVYLHAQEGERLVLDLGLLREVSDDGLATLVAFNSYAKTKGSEVVYALPETKANKDLTKWLWVRLGKEEGITPFGSLVEAIYHYTPKSDSGPYKT